MTSSRPPCPTASTAGTPASGVTRLAIAIDDPEPARPLGDESAAIRQEGDTPWVIEATGDHLEPDLRPLGIDDLRAFERLGAAGDEHQ